MLGLMVQAPEVIDAPAPQEAPPRRRRWWRQGDVYDQLEWWIGLAAMVACCVYVFVQLGPSLVLRNSTITGGDTGAHVWFPDFLIDHFLPWRVAGWSNDYYAGFPAGQFYFPFPAVLIALLDVVMPYNVAFKLVTALGPVGIPAGAFVFARGIRAPRPSAPLFALLGTAFMFFLEAGGTTMTFDLHIMGGTMASTLAGEFSFAIAIALALCFLGTLARALDRRGGLWVPAVLLALTIMSHLVVGVFAVYAGAIVWLVIHPVRNFTRMAAIGVVGVLLAAFWLLPVATNLGNTTDMRYEPIGTGINQPGYWGWLFPSELGWVYPLAAVAILAGIWYARRATLLLGVMTAVAGLVFLNWEGLRDLLGKAPAWNLRLLPFWYLLLYLFAALGAAEILRAAALGVTWVVRGPAPHRDRRPFAAWRAPVASVASPPQWVPPSYVPTDTAAAASTATRELDESELDEPELDEPELDADPGEQLFDWAEHDRAPDPARDPAPDRWWERMPRRGVRLVAMAVLVAITATVGLLLADQEKSFVPYWARYNYTGYETGSADNFTAKSWPEYKAFMDTANTLPPGRMLWEGGDAIGAYGTPLALMLLPYWTHGRIASMEGLYFEASTTTPYHFMTVATLAATPSNPVRGLPYRTIADFDLGVRYLQLMGVRYYAAFTDAAKQAAAKNPNLQLVRTVPDLDGKAPSGWDIYEVRDAPTVQALSYRPVVVDDLEAAPNWQCEGQPKPATQTGPEQELSAWECSAVPWFNDPQALDRPLTDGGPASWTRSSAATARSVPKTPLPPVAVSNIRTTESSVSFDVDRTGVPVMVKTSSYPNWVAHGAKGPWRATPNFMVVVPTSRHVVLEFETATVDRVGRVLTVVGLVGLGGLVWWGIAARRPDEVAAGEEPVRSRRARRVRFPSRSPR
jgi:hypothetical protein